MMVGILNIPTVVVVVVVLVVVGWVTMHTHAQPFGPDTCVSGYVWREAVPGDHVCVLPSVRSQAAADNAAASSRVEPNGGPFGPDTCLQGYVWREVK